MWSVGCILGELIVGKAIFQGTSTLNQIEKVLELIGRPKPEDIEAIDSPHAATILSSINVAKKKSFQSFFANASENALDFLRRLLVFNPHNRLTVEEALRHKFLEQFSSPEEEIVCDHIIEIPMDDNTKFSVKEYRDAIYSDIAKKKKEQRKKMQEKYLAQLGVTPEMLEQQKLQRNQSTGNEPSSATTASTTHGSKSSQNGPTTHHRSSSGYQKNNAAVSGYEEAKNTNNVLEKKQSYANASRPDSQAGSDNLYQKAQAKAQSLLKQGSTGTGSGYTGTNAPTGTKTSASNAYMNQYSAQTYASKPSSSQGSSTGYGKMTTSGTNFMKKK